MDRVPVSSSNLTSVGYDADSAVLEIEFHDGSVYEYFDVPTERYTGLLNATSKGSYFDVHIKKGGYRHNKKR